MKENKMNKEIFRNATTLQLELKENEIEEMISWLEEWKDSKEIRNLLLSQIHKTKFDIKMLSIKLKVIDFINRFIEPSKAN